MIKKLKIFFLFLILGGFILTPLTSLAINKYTVDGGVVSYNGMVPCGKPIDFNGNCCILPCTLCHFLIMFDNVIDFLLFTIIPVIAVLMLVIGGAVFLVSGENPRNIDKGKSIITSTVKGLVIIFAAWVAVNTFFIFIGVEKWTGLTEGWFQVECGMTVSDCDPRRKGVEANECPFNCCQDLSNDITPCKTFYPNSDPVITPTDCQ